MSRGKLFERTGQDFVDDKLNNDFDFQPDRVMIWQTKLIRCEIDFGWRQSETKAAKDYT